MLDSERQYIDLLFRASKKYGSWDPEIPVQVGDWGRITEGRRSFFTFWRRPRGTFLKENNIYNDGTAEKYGIPAPTEFGGEATENVTWIVSENAQECDVSAAAGSQTPAFLQCKVKAGFKFSSGQGALLVMTNDVISTVEPPGCLRRLMDDERMLNRVLVSQVHRCVSYARLLTAKTGGTVAVGLAVEPPVPGVASVKGDLNWVRSSNVGNFKSKVNKDGKPNYYPLFRLVSLKEREISTGLRSDDEDETPLPDALPPWQDDTKTSASESKSENKPENSGGRFSRIRSRLGTDLH